MRYNPPRVLCRCRKGKMSMWDKMCGHCRNAPHPRVAFYASLPVYQKPRKAKEADQ
jgi:hypothetical protein